MNFTDTHAHLDFPQFKNDLQKTVLNAYAKGVQKIINIGCDLQRAQKSIEIAERFENVWATVGIHPSDIDFKLETRLIASLHKMATHPKVVGVGEIGLDYFHCKNKEAQKDALIAQIKIAREVDKPIVIHTREAGKDVLEILKQENAKKVVIHCFTENQEFAEEALKRGYLLSFTGIITYPKSEDLRKVVANVPLESMMIETDCPFLAPQAFRGQRNEPAFVIEIAKKIAEIKGVDLEKVAEITTKNAERFFGI